jgi:hypothetical protein
MYRFLASVLAGQVQASARIVVENEDGFATSFPRRDTVLLNQVAQRSLHARVHPHQ